MIMLVESGEKQYLLTNYFLPPFWEGGGAFCPAIKFSLVGSKFVQMPSGWRGVCGVVQPIILSLPTRVEVELGWLLQ